MSSLPAVISPLATEPGVAPRRRRRQLALAGTLLLVLVSGCSTLDKSTPGESAESGNRPPISSSIYRVEAGDTLWSIAWRAGLDYRQLADWNQLPPPYTIYPGQRLRLTSPYPPLASARPPGRSHSVAPSSPPRAQRPPPHPQPAPSAAPTLARTQPTPAPRGPDAAEETSTILHWQWPTRGRVVQGFAEGDASRKGLKIAGTQGQPIYAAEAGRVVYSGSGLIGYGALIIIKHNKDFLSAYGYNSKILVKEGEQVTKGEHIAEMGRNGGGPPMLHFEIRRRGKPVDPTTVLPPR